MAISKSTVEHVTPSRAELQPFHKIYCQEAKCAAIFTNAGNYELHMQRHHKIMPLRGGEVSGAIRLYYCPESECVYNLKKGTSGRHFKHMKNLRQHFQKVHIKDFICERCRRTFPTQGQLRKHVETACAKCFSCAICSWDFQTKEALILHSKRKSHLQKGVVHENIKVVSKKRIANKLGFNLEESTSEQSKCFKNIPEKQANSQATTLQNKDTQTNTFLHHFGSITNNTVSCGAQTQYHDSETQTEQLFASYLMPSNSLLENINAIYHDIETQTDTTGLATIGCSDSSNILDEFHALHYNDIETQTEPTQGSHQNTYSMNDSNCDGGFLDQMLAHTPFSHMHTQTCDDYLFSELGLIDIQTQTNWTSFSSVDANETEHNKHMYTTTSTSTSTAGFALDELLVSTETQTSFTQCLLDSTSHAERDPNSSDNATTCTTGCGTDEYSNASNYVHLYNTQQTQTCDLLLGLFGGQENDLIAGFQSAYTQT